MAHLAKPFPLRLEVLRDRFAGRIGQTRRGRTAAHEDPPRGVRSGARRGRRGEGLTRFASPLDIVPGGV